MNETIYVIRTSTTGSGETSCELVSLGHGDFMIETATVRVDDAYAIGAIICLLYTDSNGTITYQTLESGWAMTGVVHQLELRRPHRVTGPLKIVTYAYRSTSGVHIGSCSYRRILE